MSVKEAMCCFIYYMSQPCIVDPCASIPCQNNGICRAVKDKSDFKCTCNEMYNGTFCENGKSGLTILDKWLSLNWVLFKYINSKDVLFQHFIHSLNNEFLNFVYCFRILLEIQFCKQSPCLNYLSCIKVGVKPYFLCLQCPPGKTGTRCDVGKYIFISFWNADNLKCIRHFTNK